MKCQEIDTFIEKCFNGLLIFDNVVFFCQQIEQIFTKNIFHRFGNYNKKQFTVKNQINHNIVMLGYVLEDYGLYVLIWLFDFIS